MANSIFPYGNIPNIYNNSINPNLLYPASWYSELTSEERLEKWTYWKADLVQKINILFWPTWNYVKNNWESPDFDNMLALNSGDFILLTKIINSNIFDEQPYTSVSATSIPSHREYFKEEDNYNQGQKYVFYDTTIPKVFLDSFQSDLNNSSQYYIGSTIPQFKIFFQRPRASQVSLIEGIKFKYEWANTSLTPSMPSGHCLYGILATAGIYEKWLSSNFQPNNSQIYALQQFGVDIGDRRVFAGVHYPSDNMSSWIIALHLANHVFKRNEIRKFIYYAITTRSRVWQIILQSDLDVYKKSISQIYSLKPEE